MNNFIKAVSIFLVNNFLNIIKNILPFGFIMYIKRKQLSDKSFVNILDTHENRESVPICDNNISNFKYVVSVQGFGYSGSGAVIDFLNEFSCSTVFGFIDEGDSKALKKTRNSFEVDFFRLSGGFFEIEKLVNSRNIYINDALVKRFIMLVDDFLIRNSFLGNKFSFYEILKNETVIFLNNIIDFSINNISKDYFNLHLKLIEMPINSYRSLYFLKELSVDEYIKIVRNFLQKIFAGFKSNHLLVLDQFFSDNEYDIERNIKYIPNLKTIFVQRDPRDVFVFAKENDIEWIPTNDVLIFIKWYKKMIGLYPFDHSVVLNIRFEDLVLNYSQTINRICKFLEIPKGTHTFQKQIFLPEHSARNIGVWKDKNQFNVEINMIRTHLEKWCL